MFRDKMHSNEMRENRYPLRSSAYNMSCLKFSTVWILTPRIGVT